VKIELRDYSYDVIISFIRREVEESGAGGIVLGLSGGIDSALTLRLCADAIGARAVTGLLLPDREEASADENDAREYAQLLGTAVRRIVISPAVSALAQAAGVTDVRNIGNIKARTRMILLYGYANSNRLLVAGTGNKSELLTGYFTKYGDGAADLLPIGDLYKTEVRQLAQTLHLPHCFLEKKPTAGLWDGQTDEGEMGLTYDQLDSILFCMEAGYSGEQIAALTGETAAVIERVSSMMNSSYHKRRTPPIPKIGIRTVGVDWHV
jgi:NAD+ synthase